MTAQDAIDAIISGLGMNEVGTTYQVVVDEVVGGYKRRQEARKMMEACAAPLRPAPQPIVVTQTLSGRTEEFIACVKKIKDEVGYIDTEKVIEIVTKLSEHTKNS